MKLLPSDEHAKHTAKTQAGCTEGLPLHLGCGLIAGIVGTSVTAPADVLRTRIMGSGGSGARQVVLSVPHTYHHYCLATGAFAYNP